MAEVVLAAEVGRPLGSRAVRRLRREGKIPAVIYGHGTEPLPVAVVARELRVALNSEAGANQLLSLDTGSGTYLALAREMQRHPVHHGDGLVDQQMFTLAINALPTAIPSSLEVDVSELTIGGQVRVSDLTLPEGVTTDVDPETAIAIGQPPRVVALEAEEGAEGELEEGATGEAGAEASGEAPEATGEEG
jgi:large subunit ribosomal protein L25